MKRERVGGKLGMKKGVKMQEENWHLERGIAREGGWGEEGRGGETWRGGGGEATVAGAGEVRVY